MVGLLRLSFIQDQTMKYQQTLLASIVSLSTLCFALPSQALPSIATVTRLSQGDIACYVDLIDDENVRYEGIFADFEICQKTSLLDKKVKLTYRREEFNDCQSEEPCGKTQTKLAIVKMKRIR
jgi:hypothetical protein